MSKLGRKVEDKILEIEIVTPTFWTTDKQSLQRVVGSYLNCPIRRLSQKSRGNPERTGKISLTFTLWIN